MSTKNVLAALGDTNTLITLGLEVAGEIVPLGKALVRGIRSIGGSTDTTTYELLLVADSTELDAISTLALADLAAINGELAKLGKAPVIPIDSGSSEPPKPPILIAPGGTDPRAGSTSQVPDPAVSAAPAQASAPTQVASSDAVSGSEPAPASAVIEMPAGGNSAVVGDTGDHGAIGDLGSNTPAVKSS